MIIKLAPHGKPGHGKEALTRDPKSVGFTDGLSNEKQLPRSILYREKPAMKYRFRTRKISFRIPKSASGISPDEGSSLARVLSTKELVERLKELIYSQKELLY